MRKLFAPIAALAMLFALAFPVAAADKLTICHATSAENNPYVAIKVSAEAGFTPHLDDNGSPLAGHEDDFLLEDTDLDTCDDTSDEATPVAPSVTAATCDAPGMLTLAETNGITYTVDPAYEAGDTGDFTVTAQADEGFFIPEGAQTVFEVTVPEQLDCVEGAVAAAPSVSPATCAAAGSLTLTPATGVKYAVSPAYSAGASGAFTVTASAEDGFELTGQTVFNVNVEAKKVCNEGTQGGNPPSPPIRSGTLAGVPNTAMDLGTNETPIVVALIAIAALAVLGRQNIKEMLSRR